MQAMFDLFSLGLAKSYFILRVVFLFIFYKLNHREYSEEPPVESSEEPPVESSEEPPVESSEEPTVSEEPESNPSQEFIDIQVSKVWDDRDNRAEDRPESITINLLANGREVDEIVLSEETGLSYTFTNLPRYDEEGNEIIYSLTEDAVPMYEASINGFTITNTYIPDEPTDLDERDELNPPDSPKGGEGGSSNS